MCHLRLDDSKDAPLPAQHHRYEHPLFMLAVVPDHACIVLMSHSVQAYLQEPYADCHCVSQ